MAFHVTTKLQQRILEGLALRQKPAQIASECQCTAAYVAQVRRAILGLSWARRRPNLWPSGVPPARKPSYVPRKQRLEQHAAGMRQQNQGNIRKRETQLRVWQKTREYLSKE